MMQRMLRVACLSLVCALAATAAFAQGGATSTLAGVVQDSSGGAIPGASVVVKNNATGATFEAVSTDNGTFTIPALNAGSYTVTVTLQGFKTYVANDVRVNAGTPASVRATLEVGGIAETVTVQGGAEIIQTQSSTVASTLSANQISNLPLTSRNAIDFVTFLPGVQTPGSNRDSTVNGLPQSTINITVDGMNVQDNYLKTSDGFFARMSPRLDAVEEVTVTTAAAGAESSGQGAVQIRFVTRSGSNDFRGSAYHYLRRDEFNANTWFNNRNGVGKPDLLQNQPGLRVGGPVVIPGLWNGRDKAFWFVNYEELRQPSDISLTRTTLHPNALNGTFRYQTSAGTREVNVLQVAAANGQLATPDPTVAALLNDIRTASLTTGTFRDNTDPLTQAYTFVQDGRSHNKYPTLRADLNITDSHRLTGSYNFQNILSNPDGTNSRQRSFPGFPLIGIQDSDRYTTSWSLRSTLGANLVNEFRAGATGGATKFNPNVSVNDWMGGDTGLANTGGYHLTLGLGLTNQFNSTTPSSREASTRVIENTLTYLKGSHSMSFGGSWTQVDLWLKNQRLVPTLGFGIVAGESADAMFNTTNFPGASSTQLTAARNFYAMMTGRVSSITGDARFNEDTSQYEYLGLGTARGRMREAGFFAQDSWRITPNFTANLGLRYELQFPFYSLNDSYMTATLADVCGVSGESNTGNRERLCNLYQPGHMPGQVPTFKQFTSGTPAFNTDWNNFAPSAGFAWTPGAGTGWRRIIGQDGDTVVRAGYALAYNRPGMSDFSDVFGANPGTTLDVTRSAANGNLGPLPLLYRDRASLGAGAFPLTPTFPFTEVVTQDVNIFDPDLQVPYADSWQVGVQRAISRNMAVEVRYVGSRSRDGWTNYNYNEVNWQDNGFFEEFKLAQANLAANIAAGRGNTFAYTGVPGTSPLPIFLAYFSGRPASQAGNTANYTSSLFSNSTFVNPLARMNPQPGTAANALDADAVRRQNALTAGLPANFLVANPHLLGGADLTGNGGKTHFHSMQVELRRRLSNGLQFDANYTAGRGYGSARLGGFRRPRVMLENTGELGTLHQALKGNVVYDLPFGRGKRFATDAGGILDRVVGGWQISSTVRVQSGELMDFGNVRVMGMTTDEVQGLVKLRIDDNGRVWLLPQDIIDNTVKAFSVSATSATGYSSLGVPEGRFFAPANGPDCIEMTGDWGDCGVRSLVVQGPVFKNVDLAVVKRIPIIGRVNAEFRVEALNAFNWVNFDPFLPGVGDLDDADEYELTGLNGSNVSRVIQIVSRISW